MNFSAFNAGLWTGEYIARWVNGGDDPPGATAPSKVGFAWYRIERTLREQEPAGGMESAGSQVGYINSGPLAIKSGGSTGTTASRNWQLIGEGAEPEPGTALYRWMREWMNRGVWQQAAIEDGGVNTVESIGCTFDSATGWVPRPIEHRHVDGGNDPPGAAAPARPGYAWVRTESEVTIRRVGEKTALSIIDNAGSMILGEDVTLETGGDELDLGTTEAWLVVSHRVATGTALGSWDEEIVLRRTTAWAEELAVTEEIS